jgi:thiol:disulfide interchange protein
MIGKQRLFGLHSVILFFCTIGIGLAGETANGLNPKQLPVVSGLIKGSNLEVIYNIPSDMHQVIFNDFNFMTVDVIPVQGLRFGETIYPAGEKDAEGNTIYNGTVTLTKKISVTDIKQLPDSIEVTAGYQFCTEAGTCLIPESVQFKVTLETLEMAVVKENTVQSGQPIATIIIQLIFAFLGGLILNVMPCVLPVLSIKILGIVNSAHEHRREILKGSIAYTFGILLSFLLLGAVVAGLKLAGQSVGWGFQFQNTSFVIFLLILVWVFGLALFDVFIINLRVDAATKASSRSGHWGSFATGVFAVLLATPCTAPMLGAALGWAFSQPPGLIIISFLVIGMGLATPFLLIGLFPVFARLIPKPGRWMNTFKEVMGFLLMATVVYLLRVAYFLVGYGMIKIIWFLLFLAVASWILGKYGALHQPKPKRIIAFIIAILIAAGAGFYFLHFDSVTASESTNLEGPVSIYQKDPLHPNWMVFSPEVLDTLLADNQSVFIDFSAEWCLTCKTNEATVLFTKEVQNAFQEYQVHLLRGDFTQRKPVIQEWLTRFNRAGVPLYILYLAGEDDPIALPELITKDMILNELRAIRKHLPE